MEVKVMWRVLRRRWWLVAFPALAALIYAGYGYVSRPTQTNFATSVRFTAAQPSDSTSAQIKDGRYYQWLTSEYVVNALTDWVKTNSFSQAVSDELNSQNVKISASALQGLMVPDNARSVMVVNITWPDPTQLVSIASAVRTVLQNRSADYFPALRDGGVSVISLDEPIITSVPPPITAQLNPLLRFGLGLAAGLILAAIVEFLDPTVHDRTEIEKLGLPVLAEIPGRK